MMEKYKASWEKSFHLQHLVELLQEELLFKARQLELLHQQHQQKQALLIQLREDYIKREEE